jgi:16S rRNA G966 N2-methylase RsmD
MGYIFFATFIPGLRECIAEFVRERLSGSAVIHKLLDGAVLFETSLSYDKLNFFCFNNIFAVIDVMEHYGGIRALEKHVTAVTGKIAVGTIPKEIISRNSGKFRSFRIAVSLENKPAAIDEKIRAEAERSIARLSGLGVNRSRPDAEFWFLYRSEGFSVFMKRLTLRASWEKSLHPGELPPPLAWTLCRLARLKHGDTVLDPFCGYGSIPFAALKYFHIGRFIACDRDRKAGAYTKSRFKNRNGGSFVFYEADFRSLLTLVPAKSVDVIVTDPPWGFYSSNDSGPHGKEGVLPVRQLYKEMFDVFGVLLKEGGTAVVLCAKEEELIDAASGSFEAQSRIPVLLSGKKTAIFRFEFRNAPNPV